MSRPDLKQKDFDEVDRLVNIATVAKCEKGVPYSTKANNIKIAALERAAEIMGITKKGKESEDNSSKEET